MTIYYNGKYPNRIESVWRVSPTQLDKPGRYMFRTNIGALYEFEPSKLLIDLIDLLGAEYDTIPSAKWVDNSEKRKPGRRWNKLYQLI